MTIRVPLRYSQRVFAHAMIDDDAEPLRDLGYYSVTLPKSLRRIAGQRSDVILAFLEEDPIVVRKCTPFISLFGTQILLVHLVMRAELANLVIAQIQEGLMNKDDLMTEINLIRGSIGLVTYASGDRTDCTRSNIREL